MTLRERAIEAMARAHCERYRQEDDPSVDELWAIYVDDVVAMLDALRAFFVENGLRVVPVEPSNEMLRAACAADEKVEAGNLGRSADLETHWAAMIAAAPDVLGEEQNVGL